MPRVCDPQASCSDELFTSTARQQINNAGGRNPGRAQLLADQLCPPAPGRDPRQPCRSGAVWAGQWGKSAVPGPLQSSCPQGSRLGVGYKHSQEGEAFYNFRTSSACSGPVGPSVQGNHVYLGQPWE